jgi:hypothetical protein
MKNLKYILFFFALSFLACQNEPLDENTVSNTEKIKKNSELHTLLEKVTSKNKNTNDTIACIDFICPFVLIVYDENLASIGTKIVTSGNQFSEFLGKLPIEQSISISYPISTTKDNNTVFTVNNNKELKIAIDSCSKADIIAYCNSLFGGCNCEEEICIWKIPYSIGNNNKYASGFFESNKGGTLSFNYDDIKLKGT